MISPFNLTILTLWFVSSFLDYCELYYYWQLKEYRFDRLKDFLITGEGKKLWLKYPILWRSLAILLIFLWPINSVMEIKVILTGFFLLDIAIQLFRYLRKKLRRPIFTGKMVLIVLSSFLLEALFFLIARDWTIMFLLILLRFLNTALVLGLFYLPIHWIKTFYINRATKKIQTYPKLKAIGITGSYGKTSVKELLSHILSANFTVIKTPSHVNTDIGIARFVLQTDFSKADIFVVEMGAYKIGEIASCAKIVAPKIGILTAINEQHLSLFGTIQKTQQAKYELLKSLPKSGLAVVNSDNIYCREKLTELECRVKTFGKERDYRPDCEVVSGKERLSKSVYTYKVDGEEYTIYTPLLGSHVSMNIAPCILVARVLGMDKDTIEAQCITQETIPQTLELYQFGESIVIDDSYNANPDGVKAAIDLLTQFPSGRKRVIITRGIPELADRSDEIHETLGGYIAFSADELVLINSDFELPLRRGVGDKYQTKIIMADTPDKLEEYLNKLKTEKAVILLENKIFSSSYQLIMSGQKINGDLEDLL